MDFGGGCGSGDCLCPPAGPPDLSHPPAAISARRCCARRPQGRAFYGQRLAADENGRVLVWTGERETAAPAETSIRAPFTYTPSYLAEKILTSKSALEGERKQVTVLFADLKGSMELLADRDPRRPAGLDPALAR